MTRDEQSRPSEEDSTTPGPSRSAAVVRARVCPRCGGPGRGVTSITLAAQVAPPRLATLAERDGWRLCPTAKCDVVYFLGAETLERDAVLSTPFHKSEDPARLVCFCFSHTVAAVTAAGAPLRAAIAAECNAGRDDCERLNPQGRCCLGNVDAVLRAAAVLVGGPAPACCGPSDHEADPVV